MVRYRLDEMTALLRAAGFTICTVNVDRAAAYPWLHFLAVAAGEESEAPQACEPPEEAEVDEYDALFDSLVED
jgi:hypothetical protein